MLMKSGLYSVVQQTIVAGVIHNVDHALCE